MNSNKPFKIYRNLARSKAKSGEWSVLTYLDPSTGYRVRDWFTYGIAYGCTFTITESTRQRSLKMGKRTAHAWLKASSYEVKSAAQVTLQPESLKEISFNPFRNPERPAAFYYVDSGQDIDPGTFKAEVIIFIKNKMYLLTKPH